MSVRYPLRDLEAVLGWPPPSLLAEWAGVTDRTVHRWRHEGLSEATADLAACRCGYHPLCVWPTWLADNLDDWTAESLVAGG